MCAGPAALIAGDHAVAGHPRAAFGERDEGIKETQAVLGSGGQVAADGAELAGAGHRAQATGYLLPQLGHPDVALRAVVRSRCRLRVMRMLRSFRIRCG